MSPEAKYEFAHLEVGEIFFHCDNKYQKISESTAALLTDDVENRKEQLFYREEAVFPDDDSVVKR